MPINILPHIFDPYFTTKPRGHGIGLTTCFSIVGRHGGFLEVDSEPGRGSTFHIIFPQPQHRRKKRTKRLTPESDIP